MAPVLVRVTLPNVSGMAADEVVNSFAFNEPSSVGAAVLKVIDFYQATSTGHSTALSAYLSVVISQTAPCIVQSYDLTGHLDGSPHGSPTSVSTFVRHPPVNANSLPDQIAAVLSYHAAYGAALETGPAVTTLPTPDAAQDMGAPATHAGRTRPKSELRGRLYFGPLTIPAINGAGVVSLDMFTDLSKAGEDLMTAALGWAVWSRRSASLHNIIGGWVDNEFGVQRRRKLKAGGKTPWTGFP